MRQAGNFQFFSVSLLKIGVMAATYQLSDSFCSLFIMQRTECMNLQRLLLVFMQNHGGIPFGPLDFVTSKSSNIFLIVFFEISKFVREIFCTLKSFKLKLVFTENTE